MNLYHFTSTVLAEGIFSMGFLPGPHRTPDNRIANVTWFTKSGSPVKTGVCDGSETMSESVMNEVERLTGKRPKNKTTHNKYQIRLSINESEIDERFERVTHWIRRYGGTSSYQKYLGLSAIYGDDYLKSIDNDKLAKLTHKKHTSDEKNWYVTEHSLIPHTIKTVEFLENNHYVPYDFMRHGIPSLNSSGIIVVPTGISHDLTSRIPIQHDFDTPQVRLFCGHPSNDIAFAIQSFGTKIVVRPGDNFEISRKEGPSDLELSDNTIISWANDNRDVLYDCWQQAVSRYYDFYPSET